MIMNNRIHINKHMHENKEHIHIYFGKEHSHNNKETASAFTIGTLMGIGGVRGMLVTLGLVEGAAVNFSMVFAFALGVMFIFVGFGCFILYINNNLLKSKQNVRRAFSIAGIVSVIVGSNMLFA